MSADLAQNLRPIIQCPSTAVAVEYAVEHAFDDDELPESLVASVVVAAVAGVVVVCQSQDDAFEDDSFDTCWLDSVRQKADAAESP